MRLAMIGFRGIPHSYGGNEEFIRHLAPRLAARGHDVIVYCRSGYYTDRNPKWRGVRRVFYPAPEHKSLGQFTHAALAMADAVVRRPDVIYIQTLPSAPFSLFPRAARQRVVINVDGMEWDRDKWGPIGKSYFRTAARISVRVATALVNDSEAMRRFYREQFGRDSYFIPYGAEIEISREPSILAGYGVEPGGYYLVVTRLVPENNPDFIVRAYLNSGVDRPLVIAGSANYSNKWVTSLLAQASQRVRFIGHVANSDHLRELHCNCHAYIHGHSLGGTNPSLLKALGHGSCVLALDNPFNREVLIDQNGVAYGELFSKDVESLAELIRQTEADSAGAAAMRLRAPDRIRHAYTWESIADRYEAMFAEVVQSGGRGRKLP